MRSNLWPVTDDDRIARAADIYGRHVVETLGIHLPWESLGAIAIERFRCDGFGVVYFVGGDIGAIKIGYTTRPLNRIAEMQGGSPIPIRFLAMARGERSAEYAYHAQFAAHRLHGEWFERCPAIEAEIARLSGSTLRAGGSGKTGRAL